MEKTIVSKSLTLWAAYWDGETKRMGGNQKGEERRCQQDALGEANGALGEAG